MASGNDIWRYSLKNKTFFLILAALFASVLSVDVFAGDVPSAFGSSGGPSIDSDSVFPAINGDLSVSYLSYIFGVVGDTLPAGRQSAILGPIFAIFNAGIIVFVGFLIGYTVLGGVMRAGQEGKVGMGGAGGDFNPWIVIRICSGMAMLVPAFAGYSLIQIMVMSTAVKGVQFANGVWNKTITYIEQTGGLAAPYISGKTGGTFSGLANIFPGGSTDFLPFLQANDCAIKHDVRPKLSVSNAATPVVTVTYSSDSTAPNNSCGQFKFTPAPLPATSNVDTTALKKEILLSSVGNFVSNYYSHIQSAPESIDSNNEEQFYITTSGGMFSALQSIYVTLSGCGGSTRATLIANARKQGWILAAQNFMLLMNKQEQSGCKKTLSPPQVTFSTMAPPSSPIPKVAKSRYSFMTVTERTDLKNKIDDQFNPQADSMHDTSQLGCSAADAGTVYCTAASLLQPMLATVENLKTGNTGISGTSYESITFFGAQPLNTVTNELAIMLGTVFSQFLGKTGQTGTDTTGIFGVLRAYQNNTPLNPLTVLSTLGTTCLTAASTFMVDMLSGMYNRAKGLTLAYMAVNLTVGLLGALMSGLFASQESTFGISAGIDALASTIMSIFEMLQAFDMWTLTLWVPLATAIGSTIYALGIMLAIYVPFIPILIYLFSGIGWIISVIEAMVAAPLVALGVTHPEGHDLLGKAEQSMMLLFGVFMRPVSITIGFIAAIMMLFVAFELFNQSFLYLISTAQIVSVTDTTGKTHTEFVQIGILLSLLMVYTYSLLAVVNYCFSLVYHIPDKIMRWIGGPQDQSRVEQMMGQVKQESQGAASKLGEGGAGSVSGASDRAGSFRGGSVSSSGQWGVEHPGLGKKVAGKAGLGSKGTSAKGGGGSKKS
jgi:conjugal transfer/type IV secretion protein DotA/TraY